VKSTILYIEVAYFDDSGKPNIKSKEKSCRKKWSFKGNTSVFIKRETLVKTFKKKTSLETL